MGKLVDGVWRADGDGASSGDGRFVRQPTKFRGGLERGKDGAAEPGRYRLYVAYACPWAHRTLLYRKLKRLEDSVHLSVVHPDVLDHGWEFKAEPEPHGFRYLYELYQLADPQCSGRATVPVLFDEAKQKIVNNESSEIIRLLDGSFGEEAVFYPDEYRADIDALNDRIYHTLNNGVYRCGFATTQDAYNEAVHELFDTLDYLEERLADNRTYLLGKHLTEADLRLFPTLLRFDLVYHHHFKCSWRRLRDYPKLFRLTRRIYQLPGVRDTVRIDDIRRHYFYSHNSINPYRIVPLAPDIDFDDPVVDLGDKFIN